MPVGTVQLITQAEYARRRGCTEGAVRRAVRDGRISLINGKIDPVAADAQWARNTRVRAGSRATDDVNLSGSGGTGGTAAGDNDDDEDSATGYWKSRARRERAEAELAELKLAELQGQLVRADDWAAALAKRAAAFREGLLQIPARLAAQLAAETDQARIHGLLEDELRQVMSQLTAAT
jgi:hypothetical protein